MMTVTESCEGGKVSERAHRWGLCDTPSLCPVSGLCEGVEDKDRLSALPDEIILTILAYVDIPELHELCKVSFSPSPVVPSLVNPLTFPLVDQPPPPQYLPRPPPPPQPPPFRSHLPPTRPPQTPHPRLPPHAPSNLALPTRASN